jgi:hypothetical protein
MYSYLFLLFYKIVILIHPGILDNPDGAQAAVFILDASIEVLRLEIGSEYNAHSKERQLLAMCRRGQGRPVIHIFID